MKSLIVPVSLALLSFFLGQLSEKSKLRNTDERVATENRRRVFASTTQELGIYLTQWARFRTISEAEQSLEAHSCEPSAVNLSGTARRELAHCIGQTSSQRRIIGEALVAVKKRKERYLEGRDAARDKLAGNLEQARLFFGPATAKAIVEFETFERNHANKSLAELPPIEQWRSRATGVFEAMMGEIKDDEMRFQSP